MILTKKGTARISISPQLSQLVQAATTEVEGYIIGDFIIHESLGYIENRISKANDWTIAHIPSGMRIVSGIRKLGAAKKYATRLDQLFPKHGWLFGMQFRQNMFVTNEMANNIGEYVNAIPRVQDRTVI